MCIKNIQNKAKRYKFFKVNLWGKLFVLKNFKGRRVMYARINRRHTLRKIRVNAMKLRRKSHTIKGLGLLAAARFKNFYITLSNHKLKNYIKKARKLPFYKLKQYKANKPFYIEDKLVGLLEFRVESVLQRLGLFSVQQIRQMLSHRKICLNGRVVTCGSTPVIPGDKLFIPKQFIKDRAFRTFIGFKKVTKFINKQYRAKKKYPMLQLFLTLNKLNYISYSF